MEKLHILPKAERCVLFDGGNEVLLLTYPTVTGTTPAALHAAALIEALAAYAREQVVPLAAAALKAAVASGHIFDFTKHTYEISLTANKAGRHLLLTLRAHWFGGNETFTDNTLTLCFDESEHMQKRAPRGRHRKSCRT